MSNKKLYLIIRILGNDLKGLHGNNQTITNLEFTLKNEYMFEDTKKIFVLNRIINIGKKKEIIKLLNYYNIEFIDLPFNIDEFNKLPKNIPTLSEYKNCNRTNMVKILEKHNLYLINNNGCRNYCISYGKKSGYTWTFVLDSNSFFTKKTFENIANNINMNDEYLILPQKRLKDSNLSNEILLTKDYENKLNRLPNQEPQIAFKNTSNIMFNSNIPYGLAPKAELLTALNVKGKWNNWMNFYKLDIKPRTFKKKNYNILSYVIRLTPLNNNNDIKNNWELRWIGIYLLVKQILDTYKEDI
tara:strand:+ start:385 stop:1284 length:900 start_codon:yes stop_codon:yes gene_type:complete